jgi:large subunit ribosomal protein L45
MTIEEVRAEMKKKGIQPRRPWSERVFYISNTGMVMEPYVPPEGDGKLSAVTVGVISKL